MIPIKDENPTYRKSYIRLVILILCTSIFLFQEFSGLNLFIINYFGFKPITIIEDTNLPTLNPILTIFSSMFLHGGWMHFLGNMLYLWIFADNVEDVFGRKKFIFFYLSSGFIACLSQFIFNISSQIPIIGASGAIAGVLGAYLFLFPKAKILVLFPFLIIFTLRVPAYILLMFWFIYQFSYLQNSNTNVAWVAHVGGFIYGVLFTFLMRKKNRTGRKKGKSVFLKKKGPWN